MPVIFVDLPTQKNHPDVRSIVHLYYRLLRYFFRKKGVLYWNPVSYSIYIDYVIFFVFVWIYKIFYGASIILYTTSANPDRIYAFIPSDLKVFECLDNPNNELNENQKTIQKFHLVFANTPLIFNQLKTINQNCHLISAGYDHYQISPKPKVNIPNTAICLGGISHRINFEWLYQAVIHLPNIQFYFFGEMYLLKYYIDPIDGKCERYWQKIIQRHNVHHFNFTLPSEDARSLISIFSVGIIPYNTDDQFTYYSHPMKLYDYLACKMPVVSTPIPSVVDHVLEAPIYIARTVDEFISLIKKHSIIKQPMDASVIKKIQFLIHKQDIDTKINQIVRLVNTYQI